MNYSTEKTKIHSEILFSAVCGELRQGRKASFTVTGISMWPFLAHDRDQVIIAACDPASLKVGDIILFQTPLKNYMLHRVTGLKTGLFETTGDGNCFRDGWFPSPCLRGRVETIVRKGNKIDCNSLRWRTLFSLWMFLFPVRRQLLRLLRRIGRLKANLS